MTSIRIRGARQHNLKNLDLDLPRRALVVVSGVSGSGKSSLVFDTLYAEGQRRYVESLSTYTKQVLERMEKPDVDLVAGISPAIAIRQQNNAKSARSTVGTATEVYDYLRLLFARTGTLHCPQCDAAVRPDDPSSGARRVLGHFAAGTRLVVLFEIAVRPGSDPAGLYDSLRAAGFARLWVNGAPVDLDVATLLPAGAAQVEVVADRLVARPESRTRLAEALETALRAGDGFAAVADVQSGERLSLAARPVCARCRVELPVPTPSLFSFNNPLGACPECRGFGNRLEFSEQLIVPDPELTLEEGALAPWATPKFEYYQRRLEDFCRKRRIPLRTPWHRLPRDTQLLLLEGGEGWKGMRRFLEGLRAKAYKKYARFFTRRFMDEITCTACRGSRLRPEALLARVGGVDLAELSRRPLGDLQRWVEDLELPGEARAVAADVLAELRARLRFLCEVGVEYLTLDRLTRTLSGGEAQRINLANSLGADLVDALYVLDEPTVGMHARDTQRLVRTLQRLRDLGNSVVLVEHDLDVIAAADWLVDLGPGAGAGGGEIVFSGPRAAYGDTPAHQAPAASGSADASRTLAHLTGAAGLAAPPVRRTAGPRWLVLENARLHNLKGVTARFPLGLLVCVTGVSGSGKSTLVSQVLHEALTRRVPPDRGALGWYDALHGAHLVHDVVLVDQSPIGRTPRSNPLSYMKGLADVRAVFAATAEARLRRLGPGAFSFNTPGGRCEACEGMGWVQIEMHFMADLFVRCDHCEGRRFGPQVLEVRYRGRDIAEVLEMTVDEALAFFHDTPSLGEKLYVLKRVGLGYLRLGQPAPTLSGGESQRLKIARALAHKGPGNLLYLLDEPTTGLHPDDVAKLLRTLHELVDRGHSVLVVEHHLDVVQSADWIVDLGPEGGGGGGEIVYAGPPAGLKDEPRSWTGRCLQERLKRISDHESAGAAARSS
jgi:excinuclease ABC subunit A